MRKLGFFKVILLSIIIGIFVVGCNDNENNTKNNGSNEAEDGDIYPNEHLIANVDWLHDHIDDDDLFIIDARSEGFEDGHIPGAVQVSSGSLNDEDVDVAGFLLNEDKFTELFQEAGLNEDDTVVVYDDGNSLSASRVFYALEYYGLFDKVKILEGGYAAWLTVGNDIDTGEAEPRERGNFVADANDDLFADRDDVEQLLDSDDVVILDTRSEEEYTGEDPRQNKHGGRIPGAVHKEWTDSLEDGEDGVTKFLDYEDLKANFDDVGVSQDKKIVPYCQTNVRGAHSYFTLRLLGFTDIQPYEGSWAEWGNLDDTEIEQE